MRTLILTMALLGFAASAQAATAEGFNQWKRGFMMDAANQGITARTLSIFDQDAQFVPKAIELDRSQPETKQTYAEYYTKVVTQSRIDNGRARFSDNRNMLADIENRSGVPAEIIVALWGMETSYGGYTGNWGILSALATLAYEGRRADFFRGELMNALKILQEGRIPASQLRGSWAGAMGQVQFMPSSYLAYAVDGDGDGKRDLWNSESDALSSAANYLRKSGWQPGLPWGVRAKLNHDIAPGFVGLDADQGRTMASWHKAGVGASELGFNVPTSEKLWLVAPDGLSGPSYLVTRNYKVIMKWNKSTYFATSVGRLSDALKEGSRAYRQAPQNPGAFNE